MSYGELLLFAWAVVLVLAFTEGPHAAAAVGVAFLLWLVARLWLNGWGDLSR